MSPSWLRVLRLLTVFEVNWSKEPKSSLMSSKKTWYLVNKIMWWHRSRTYLKKHLGLQSIVDGSSNFVLLFWVVVSDFLEVNTGNLRSFDSPCLTHSDTDFVTYVSLLVVLGDYLFTFYSFIIVWKTLLTDTRSVTGRCNRKNKKEVSFGYSTHDSNRSTKTTSLTLCLQSIQGFQVQDIYHLDSDPGSRQVKF